jgi:hypothetical protein
MRSPTLPPAFRRPGSLNVVASIFVVALAIESASTAHAQVPTYEDVGNADEWAQSEILRGLSADFDKRCGGRLDPEKGDDRGRTASRKCRTLHAAFLEDILKRSPLRDALPDNGVDVRGAKIIGDVRLSFATLEHPLRITNSRFEGGIFLDDARAERFVDLSGSSVSGALNANALQVGGAMHMHSSDQTQSSFHEVSLIGARVVGDLDMVAVRVDGNLNAHGLQVGGSLDFRSDDKDGRQASVSGAVTLEGAHIERDLNLNEAQVEKNLNANALQVGGAMHMHSSDQTQSSFHDVSLIGAKVVGDVDMVGIRVNGILNAHSLQVGGSLVLRSDAKARQAMYGSVGSGTAIDLTSAKVAGNVDMDGVSVNGPFDAAGLQVGESLLMRPAGKYVATLHEIFLGGAKIDGSLEMTGALVAGNLDVTSAHVGGSLSMQVASLNEVLLRFARVDGNLNMMGACVTKLDASSLHVGESLLMMKSYGKPGASHGETPASVGEIALGNAKIDNHLDLAGARIAGLDAPSLRVGGNLKLDGAEIAVVNLEAASIGGQIRVGAEHARAKIKEIDLTNARAGSLLDGGKPWPEKMHLDGFTFSRLAQDMIKRPHDDWDEWAHRDESKSSYPYEQLAAAHAAAGDRDAADYFHYNERMHAAESASWPERTLSYVLRYVAGYGIGYYMFYALYWAIGLSVVGALILSLWVRGVAEGNHGFFWCLGASVDRLLPFITLKKEFSDFFNDPQVNKFTRWQDLFFIVFGVLGWVLGGIVLAAMGTFTKGS